MPKQLRKILTTVAIAIFLATAFYTSRKINFNQKYEVGQKIDSLNGVLVYFNGGVGNVSGRELTQNGYNIGLKYQCVEFVKRYYFEALNHQMPDSYGNAKDFFNPKIKDGALNKKRNLTQYINFSQSKPQVNDLLVYSGTLLNKYGHVAIVSKVTEGKIEIIQQNPGPFTASREVYSLIKKGDKWVIDNDRILGWLRK